MECATIFERKEGTNIPVHLPAMIGGGYNLRGRLLDFEDATDRHLPDINARRSLCLDCQHRMCERHHREKKGGPRII